MMNKSENNFRDFFKNNIDFLFILDMEGNIIETNNTVHDVLGYSEEELTGQSVLMIHPPEFREKAAQIVAEMIKGKASVCPVPLMAKDKKYIPVETRVFKGFWNAKEALIGVSRNMTELNISEEKFHGIFDLSPVLKAISTINTGIFIHVNKTFLRTLGYEENDILGKSSKDLDLFYDAHERQKALKVLTKEGHVENLEVRIKSKSGQAVECLFSVNTIKTQNENFLLTTAVDISALKHAEARINSLYKQQKLLADISQLLNSPADFKKVAQEVVRLVGEHTKVGRVFIFEDSADGLFANNTYEWCSKGVKSKIESLQNIPYKSVPSWKPLMKRKGYIYSNDRDQWPEDIDQIIKFHHISSLLAFPLLIQNNYCGFIGFDEYEISREWSNDEIEMLRAISHILSNTFERNRVKNELEISELRLKLAIESANEGLWDWHNETGYVYYNDIWCQMLGYKKDEIIPHVSTWESMVHPDDIQDVMDILDRHLNGETEYYETVHRIKAKDGSWHWMLDHGRVVQRDEKGKAIRTVGTHIDVTRQKETEQKLQELISTKDKLFSIIAHDLRGPLGSFLPVLDLLTSDKSINEVTKNEILEELKRASKTTFSLLENLLNWSRSQTNSIVLRPSSFNLKKLIDENVDLLSSNAHQKGISVNVSMDEKLRAFADKESISLVIRNLLSNSLKFTPRNGKVLISAAIKKDDRITVDIVDNGVGMEKEVVESLFKFETYYSTRGTDSEKGAGIGLLLCKDFVERNGGEIHVESTPGAGSDFSFTLPGRMNE